MDPKKLIPTHLADELSIKELKGQVTEAIETPAEPDSVVDMRKESYTFQFAHKARDGRLYQGTFTHRVPTVGQRLFIGSLRTKLGGGVPYDTLDPLTRELAMMIADLSVTLAEEGRPAWAEDFRNLHDTDVLYRLWEVTSKHEDMFLRRDQHQGAGAQGA